MDNFFPGLRHQDNPVVFFDFSTENKALGRLKFELFADTSPKIAELFRKLCVGEFQPNGKPLGYFQAEVLQILQGQYMTIDIQDKEMIGNLLQPEELMENMQEKHELGSIGFTLGSSTSEFYIAFAQLEWLDGVLPCFGRIYELNKETTDLLKTLELALTLQQGKPAQRIIVTQCGQM